jgi:uncharacterized cupredoxin-like copper-binding protein
MLKKSLLAAGLVAAVAAPALAEGFLVGRPQRVPDLVIGLGDAGYEWKQEPMTLETGKGYRMWLKATGAKECAFQAPEFFENVWFRKIEVNKVELKVQTVNEIEFEQEGSAELFFTPIKPGDYTWKCNGLEDKGLTGKITVK